MKKKLNGKTSLIIRFKFSYNQIKKLNPKNEHAIFLAALALDNLNKYEQEVE